MNWSDWLDLSIVGKWIGVTILCRSEFFSQLYSGYLPAGIVRF